MEIRIAVKLLHPAESRFSQVSVKQTNRELRIGIPGIVKAKRNERSTFDHSQSAAQSHNTETNQANAIFTVNVSRLFKTGCPLIQPLPNFPVRIQRHALPPERPAHVAHAHEIRRGYTVRRADFHAE